MQRMIADLRLPVELRMGPTHREPDGLAMSSRNRYLEAGRARGKRRRCTATLARVRDQLRGGARDFARLTADARRSSSGGVSAGLRRDSARKRISPQPMRATGEQRIVLGAARLGRARLIDNLLV